MKLEYQGRKLDLYCMMDEEGTAVRDKNNNQRKNDRERALYQYDKYIWINQQDFGCVPKKGRQIKINSVLYEIRAVASEFGEFILTVRRLDE